MGGGQDKHTEESVYMMKLKGTKSILTENASASDHENPLQS